MAVQSSASSFSGSRRRDLAVTGAFVALALAGMVAARGLGDSCPAQVEAARQAQPGMVLMAGDPTDPACVGKRRMARPTG
ncbi:MAG: hypothetical protein ACKOUT_16255 [Novosphingobium sp.]